MDDPGGTRAGAPMIGRIGALWGLAGVVTLLAFAVHRLLVIAIDAFGFPFAWWHWGVLVVSVAFMAYSEGYRGFQRSYSPRVVARARHLLDAPTPGSVALAPLFCMGYFRATRRRLVSTYLTTAAIVALVMLFQFLGQPLRGILDAGIVAGLAWGISSIVAIAAGAFFGAGIDASPELGRARPLTPSSRTPPR